MRTFKKAKVVRLSTTNDSNIYLKPQDSNLVIVTDTKAKKYATSLNFPKQHLYIISDNEIKEGDWIIDSIEVIQTSFKLVDSQTLVNRREWKKIIATTDTSLDLPQPSEQFIQKYIEEHNRGNIISDVLVEYELISNEEYFLNTINPDDDVPYFDERLKINPKDNTITIKKVKDSYTREEVENLIYSAMTDRCYTTVAEWKKWIEKNL